MAGPILAASADIPTVTLALASSGIGPISANGLSDLLKVWTGVLANWVEVIAAIIIAGAVIEAAIHATTLFFKRNLPLTAKEVLRLQLGRWLAVALEFELAADILRTAIAPSWNEIGLLAAVAAIRTALNYFLEKEIERGASLRRADEHGAPHPTGERALHLRSPFVRAERAPQRPEEPSPAASATNGDSHEPAPA